MGWTEIAERGGGWGYVASVARAAEEIRQATEQAETSIRALREDADLREDQRGRRIAGVRRRLDAEIGRWLEFGRSAQESAREHLLGSWSSLKPSTEAVTRVRALADQGVSTADIISRARETGDADMLDAAASLAAYGSHGQGMDRRSTDLHALSEGLQGAPGRAGEIGAFAGDLGSHAQSMEETARLASAVATSDRLAARERLAAGYAEREAANT